MPNHSLFLWIGVGVLWLIAGPLLAADVVQTETLRDQPVLTSAIPAPVVAQPLRDVAADTIGAERVVPELPRDGWRGTDYEQALRLIGSLPSAVPSPAARQLQVAVLTSALRSPVRQNPLGGSEPLLLRQRLDRLWYMGQWAAYNALVEKIPKTQRPMPVLYHYTLARVIAGQIDAACADSNLAAREYPSDLFWHQAQMYCAIKAGETEQARLWWSLWREKNPTNAAWQTVIDAALARKPNAPLLVNETWGPWHYLLALAAELPLVVKDSGSVKDTLSQVVVLNSAGVPAALKIDWAENLALSGAISGRKLGEIYALARSGKTPSTAAIGRALLWQQETALATIEARAIKTADHWASLAAENEKRWFALSRAPWVKSLGDDPALAFFAPVAARVLLLAGEGEAAEAWLTRIAEGSAEAIKNWPVTALGGVPTAQGRLGEAWVDNATARQLRSLEQLLALLQLLAQALQQNQPFATIDRLAISPSAEALTLQTAQVPSAALTLRLRQATRQEAMVEMLALSLLALRGDLGAHSDVALAEIVAVWRQSGHATLARDLAREIVVLRE